MNPVEALRKKFSKLSNTTLTLSIVVFALVLIYLAFKIKNPWVKAGILAWEILP